MQKMVVHYILDFVFNDIVAPMLKCLVKSENKKRLANRALNVVLQLQLPESMEGLRQIPPFTG